MIHLSGSLFTFLIVIGVSLIVHWFFYFRDDAYYQLFGNTNGTRLIVLILSARSNFDNRDLLRQTWLQNGVYGKVTVKSFFVIGDHDCDVPVEHREDPFNCSPWIYNETEDLKKDVSSHVGQPVKFDLVASKSHQVLNGFSFKVHQEILLKRVGCLSPCHCDHIVLKNVINQEVLLNLSFDGNEDNQSSGYNYQEIAPILLLPKGFIGLLIATGSNLDCQPNSIHEWNHFSKLFQILRVYADSNDYESQVFNGDELIKTSFVVELSDQGNYRRIIKDQKEGFNGHTNGLDLINQRLKNEMKQHNDIISVDVIDVYRNLPKKLVNGIKWIVSTYNFDLILKTDDDCHIDLHAITRKINQLKARKSIWWGNFRRNSLINIYGKWAEKHFPGSVYPTFACGSGYVISADIAEWIVKNKDHLHYFQGEDVSMGIWLSSIIPTYLMDRDWACAEDHPRDGQLAYCQLNSSQLLQFYKIKSVKDQENKPEDI